MGFKKNWDVADIESQLHCMAIEICSPYNDGWTSSLCKHDLFRIKCLVEDIYARSPKFSGEDEWEKERTMELLKRK
jgi:hypothetical protein